jgi:hypothetical protein
MQAPFYLCVSTNHPFSEVNIQLHLETNLQRQAQTSIASGKLFSSGVKNQDGDQKRVSEREPIKILHKT